MNLCFSSRLGRLCCGAGVILAALASPQTVSANLFVNGSFEFVGALPGSPASTYTTDYAAIAGNTLTGWTSTLSSESGAANYLSTAGSSANWIPDPIDGSFSVQLDSSTTSAFYNGGNALEQSISLVANTPYHLSFYMSAEAARGQPTTSLLNVILNGGGFSGFTTTFTANRTGTDTKATSSEWVLQTMDFTPLSSGLVSLTFQDIYNTNGTSSNASLDNVALVAMTIPEPSTLSALGLGLLLFAGLTRFRRKV